MVFPERKLFLMQRISAAILAPLVVVHLLLILYAVRHGMTGDDVLNRTAGNVYWALFYLIFVVAVSIHAPLGLRNVLKEWTPLSLSSVNRVAIILFGLFLVLGIRSVIAVIAPGS